MTGPRRSPVRVPLLPSRSTFALRRAAIDGVHLNAIGFKIGLEVIARARTKRIVEVPYTFRDRELGASKFGRREVGQYLVQLGQVARDKLLGRLRRKQATSAYVRRPRRMRSWPRIS